jgi:predicted TIM-barrel fold metal-dependent hydrolase
VLISADSHVIEPHDLWEKSLPAPLRDQAPRFPAPKVGEGFQGHPGGQDPTARLAEMAVDGVSAEVLYPTLTLSLFDLDDARLQETCFRIYNDWLIEYCQTTPDRLIGLAAIATYDIDHAITELTRCAKAGFRGALVWQAPHPDLPFTSDHYDRLWAAAQDLNTPISLHILTGHSYHKGGLDRGASQVKRGGLAPFQGAVNLKIADVANAIFGLVYSGALARFPELKIVNVETEAGWLPFYEQQWDYYFHRYSAANPPIAEPPSTYIRRQVYTTFFNDSFGARQLSWWGQDTCMWSNDFPHPNSTWPHSLDVIQRDLGHLQPEVLVKILSGNVQRLYGLSVF